MSHTKSNLYHLSVAFIGPLRHSFTAEVNPYERLESELYQYLFLSSTRKREKGWNEDTFIQTHTKNVSMITHILNSKCVYHTQFVFRWLAVILFFCSPEYIQAYSMWLKQMQCALKQEYVLFAQFIPNMFVSARSTHYAIKNKARQGYNTASVVRLVFSQ